jgi:hypothetical protein
LFHPYLFAVGLPCPEEFADWNVDKGAAAVRLALEKRGAIGLPDELTSFQGLNSGKLSNQVLF